MRILFAGLLFSTSIYAAEPVLAPLTLQYAVEWGRMSLGVATITLKPGEAANCYRYESDTQPIGMVRFFYGSPFERSEFCVEKKRIVPKHFLFFNPKRKKDGFTLDFDWKTKMVISDRAEPRALPDNAQDRFGLQQAVRLWVLQNHDKKDPGTVEFSLVDDDRIKLMSFAIIGPEKVKTPAGEFDTLLVQRVNDPKKISKYWLAPSRDYMPVKVEQIKDGDSQFKMLLKS